VQLQAAVESLFEVNAGCFTPRPRVDSAVVALTPLSAESRPSKHCLDLVRAGYAQRRKTLPNALSPLLGRTGATETVARAGLEPTVRAEELSLAQWRLLTESARHQ
jgi:16S rRNA (adenine1518-N6/adenine1519-N6)-dimethyltransferase